MSDTPKWRGVIPDLIDQFHRYEDTYVRCTADQVRIALGDHVTHLVQERRVASLSQLKHNLHVDDADTLRCILSHETGVGVDLVSDSYWRFLLDMMITVGFPAYKATDSLFVLLFDITGPPPTSIAATTKPEA